MCGGQQTEGVVRASVEHRIGVAQRLGLACSPINQPSSLDVAVDGGRRNDK
jgi:hypothetical protein